MTTQILAIAGGSASGKTTLARAIQQRVGADHATIVRLDWYYATKGEGPADWEDDWNFDHPRALDFPLFVEHLRDLARGVGVEAPQYDFATHTRLAQTLFVAPRPLIIVDGILVLHDPNLRATFDASCFLDCDEALRLSRRVARDVEERGRTEESVRRQFTSTVGPMHAKYVEPSRAHASVRVSQQAYLDDVDAVMDAILDALPPRTPPRASTVRPESV